LQQNLPPNNLPSFPNTKFILIGEDDTDDQEFLKEIFTEVDSSFFLLFEKNGRKIIDYLEQLGNEGLPCLILLDYNMPDLNGAEILGELNKKTRYKSIPKIIWSTSGSSTFRKSCLDLGANDYFIKPSKVSDMVNLINKMLSICQPEHS